MTTFAVKLPGGSCRVPRVRCRVGRAGIEPATRGLKAPCSTTELTARQGILRGQTGLTIDSEAVRAGPWDRLGQPVPIDLGNRLRGGPRARPLRTVFDNATGEHLRGVVEGC